MIHFYKYLLGGDNVFFYLSAIVGISVVYDFFTKKIPNYVMGLGYIGVLLLQIRLDGVQSIPKFLLHILIVGSILFLIYLIRGLGAGDVKLMTLISSILSLEEAAKFCVLVLFLGAIIGLSIKVLRYFSNKNDRKLMDLTSYQFGIPIFFGYLILLISKGGFY